ncbi:MMPL family transporter, partial [Patescibacteria group bacterium]|nr:MMPL family transporter [Patescibacteria group bacterium]
MLNYRLLILVGILIAGCAALGLSRLAIDTDVVRSLPNNEKIIAGGLEIFEDHPLHDQVAVDIKIDRDDPDILVECGTLLEQKMKDSRLFAQVGTGSMSALIPQLAFHVARNLPLLFSAEELREIAPLLDSERINERIRKLREDLGGLEGVGQADFISIDPLGLKDAILAKMALMAPSLNSRFYRGSLLSADGRHLLVTARPRAAGTDTASAQSISALFAKAAQELAEQYEAKGVKVTLTPVGAYRAALDNERIIRHDVGIALLLATAGIALLLLLAFSRPLIGLLSLVPAIAGTAVALLVFSLFFPAISIMVLGFGGAIISISVDYGIAYLLFLDSPQETKGEEASHEVKAVGIMAVVTTVVAFLILSCSGFPIFTQLGVFTAMGLLFSFLFVHTIFPKILPAMPAGRHRDLPLQKLVNILYSSGKPGAVSAVMLALTLLFFAKPQFHISLDSMNTVSRETEAADALFTDVWGKIGDRIFLMNTADSIAAIQQANDLTLSRIEEDMQKENLSAAFVPSMIFPGRERAASNLAAWRSFWNRERVAQVEKALNTAGGAAGFTPDAFVPFYSLFDPGLTAQPLQILDEYYNLLGISKNSPAAGLIQFITVVPGKNYDSARFLARYGGENRIFDATFFTKRLAGILFSTFTTMLVIIAVSVALLIFLVSLSLPVTLLTLLPALFSYVCTLGTMRLIHHPLDIPSLMLSIVILGMGIDYAIFCVRAHQRYRDIAHPSYVRARSSVFLSGTSTLIGFGVLGFADHSLLRSIGITSSLGIAYSLLGTFLLLPPLLNFYFAENDRKGESEPRDIARRVRRRYRTVEAYPRMFARGKLRFDPMFADLPRMLAARKEVKTIVDIGCGYG